MEVATAASIKLTAGPRRGVLNHYSVFKTEIPQMEPQVFVMESKGMKTPRAAHVTVHSLMKSPHNPDEFVIDGELANDVPSVEADPAMGILHLGRKVRVTFVYSGNTGSGSLQ